MSAMQNAYYLPAGGWLQKPDKIQPELEGDVSADVIIVGAGFAGLSTALELTAAGAKVIVLERDFAGFGASGRNAGYLAGGHGLEHELFLKRVGREQAKKIVEFYQAGVPYVEGKLAEYSIDCDYQPTGLIRAGVHPSQEKRLRDNMTTGIELGAPAQFLDEAAMRARGIPPAFLFGFLTNNGGTLDPGKYVLGLRRAAIQAGVTLYENSALISHSEGQVITCNTAKGQARAPHLIFATNAYTPQLGLLKNKIAILRVSAIETEPLSEAQLGTLGWHNREGITTQHYVMESHRLTARNSLVVTTKRLHYMYGGQTPSEPDSTAYRDLAAALHDRFPTLRGVGLRACWSGYISFAHDGLPVVGEAGANNNILYTAGCSGHGVGTQSLMGRLLAEKVRGVEHPLLAALRHETPSAFTEPFEWGLMKSMLGAAHMMDDQVDRKVRKITVR
nr:FAD-dependent oxidoreductase [Sphingomonas sp. CDS-1]